MTTYALMRRARRAATWGVGGWVLLVAVAGWSVLVIGGLLGSLPASVSDAVYSRIDPFLFLLIPPVLLILAAALSNSGRGSAVRVAAAWATLLAALILVTIFVLGSPVLIAVPPLIAISALVCSRRPAAAAGFAFLLTGTFNTVEAFTPIPAGPTVDVVLAGLWAATIWHYLFVSRARPVWLWPGVALSMLYLLITVAQIGGSETFYMGLYGFRVTAWYMLAFLLLAYSPWGPSFLRGVAKAIVLTAALVGAYALFRWLTGPSAREAAMGAAQSKYEQTSSGLKLFGSLPSGHHLSGWAGVVVPFCLAYALTARGRWRLLAAAAVALCTFALWASDVRTGLVGAVAGMVVVIVLYQLSQGLAGPRIGVTLSTILILGALGVGTFVTAVGGADDSTSRYTTIFAPKKDPSVQARFDKWRIAMREIRHHPLGEGIGAAGEAHQRYGRFVTNATFQLDNSYLLVALEQGLVIMGLYIAALVAVLLGLSRRAITTRDPAKTGLAIGAAGTLTSFMLVMTTIIFIQGLTALAAFVIVGIGVGQFTSPTE